MEKISSRRLMKRVLNIVPYPFLPYSSGGQKLIALFNEYLGVKTTLHVAGTTDNVTNHIKNYQFHPVLSSSRWRYLNPLIPFRLIRLIQKNKIDTVILEHPYYGWMIPFFRLLTRASIICHTHNVESERFRSIGKKWWRLLALYEGVVLRHCNKILCITEEDRRFFIEKMHVKKTACIIVPYGIVEREPPTDKAACKSAICEKHQLDPDLPLLFFNGALDYQPNRQALDIILNNIHQKLQSKGFECNILIAGRNLPASYKRLEAYNHSNIYYAGFVNDISLYTKAADILLNPVVSGGGVKTKMVEALGLNTSVVSTKTGAMGVSEEVCGNKMTIVPDDKLELLADLIMQTKQHLEPTTPTNFYNRYYWGNIIDQLLHHI